MGDYTLPGNLDYYFPIGCRVLLCGGHVWDGHVGTIVDYQVASIINKRGAIVELDNETSCFVFDAAQMEKVQPDMEEK